MLSKIGELNLITLLSLSMFIAMLLQKGWKYIGSFVSNGKNQFQTDTGGE